MPGFNQKQVANNVRNANTVEILLGDQVVMFAQTVGHQISMGAEQLYGIGSGKPQEIQQLRFSPSFSLDSFSLTQAGLDLFQSGVNLDYILAGNQFDMHVLDGLTNTVAYSYVGAKAQNMSQSVSSNAPVRSNYSFLAMDVLDPDGDSIMDSKENALAVTSSAVSVLGNAIGGGLGLSA